MYRVGPLARLNVCRTDGRAQGGRRTEEFQEARPRRGHVLVPVSLRAAHRNSRVASNTSSATWTTRNLSSDYLRADAGINSLRGVGVSEAPRGTLFHDYTVDRNGLLQKVNLIVATGQNNLAMNQTVAQIARHYVRGNDIPEADAQPRRTRHPLLRPVLELLDARRRPDAAAHPD